jgi:peptide-methionine (R)-S-oxide reductase
MITRRFLLSTASAGALATAFLGGHVRAEEQVFRVTYSDEEWRKRLNPRQYAVLRESATEYPGSSPLLHEERRGVYACAGCDFDLFSSETKYATRTGWPSFWAPLENAIGTTRDTSLGVVRVAVHCAQCGGHLGHVFTDGPQPTGLRYCMNGVAMKFKPTMA